MVRLYKSRTAGETTNMSIWVQVLGNRAIESKMIIWKLCNHSGYKIFVEERKGMLEAALKKQPANKRYLEVLDNIISMEERLQKVDPLYIWDDSYLIPKPFKGVLPSFSVE